MSTLNEKKAAELAGKRLLDNLQNDLRSISNEAKKKMPSLKETAESGIVRLRSASSRCSDLNKALTSESAEIMEPFFMGCNSKIPKIVQTSLSAIQRLITFQAISVCAAEHLINCLWSLMESQTEELKILQTITLLISTNNVVQEDNLAKSIALCFRLHFTKNQIVINTASATIRQLCTVIYERVIVEDSLVPDECQAIFEISYDELKQGSKQAPRSLKPCAADAFLLLQDLIQLVNADNPFWLTGLTEMTRTFGLELLESIFNDYPQIFNKHEEFSFLLKERVCPLIIKLFSPNIKYKQFQKQLQQQQLYQTQQQQSQTSLNTLNNSNEKPFFPISIRLLRIVNVIISKYYAMLITESEIFLSLLIKFLENDKPNWQRATALEVVYKMVSQPNLIKSFCLFYDMKPNSSKILKDISNALGIYAQSAFIVQTQSPGLLSSLIGSGNQANGSNLSLNTTSSTSTTSTQLNAQSTANQSSNNLNSFIQTPQPAFFFKGQWFPILNFIRQKSVYLDLLDKMDTPQIPDGYGLSSSYFCMIELVKSVLILVSPLNENEQSTGLKPSSSSSSLSNGSIIKLKMKDHSTITTKIDTIKKLESVRQLDEDTLNLHQSLLNSTWAGIYAVFSLLIEASTDEEVTEQILDLMEQLIAVLGVYNLRIAREAMVNCLCKASLPTGYQLPQLNFTIPLTTGTNNTAHIRPTGKVSSPSTPVPGSSINLTESNSKLTSNFGEKSNYLTQLSNNAIVLQQQNSQLMTTSNFFSSVSNTAGTNSSTTSLSSTNNAGNNSSTQNDLFDFKQQVVAVGTALYTGTSNSTDSSVLQQAPTSVMLTAKNLQCMKVLLKVAHHHGIILKENWYSTLLTLQHLVWILGLKTPSTGGSLKSSTKQNSIDSTNNSLITTAAMSDLPMLTAMLTRLFESSHYAPLANLLSNVFQCSMELDDESLVFLVNALCKLSKESMDIAYNNREPSLFAVAKLLETGLVNLFRYKIFWNQITDHLLIVCQHPHIKIREWGCETLTTLVKTALQTSDKLSSIENSTETSVDNDEEVDCNIIFLRPFQSLSEIVFVDIRQKQLDCCLQILQTSGDTMTAGWPQLLYIIGCIDKLPNESLIRLAFQCLQLIISDLLNQIPSDCLVLLVNTTEKFASQCQELNVSLTAIGLLWNIADFFHQNREKIKQDLKDLKLDFSSIKMEKEKENLKPFDCLYMCLFSRLGDLCTDERPAIRKSASQTLFHTLGTHANILEESIWSSILYEVLGPLLERVHTFSINASSDKIVNISKSMGITGIGVSSSNLMLHHTRNTAAKQWSETLVLTLAGVSHVFSEKRHILMRCLDDFSSAWRLLLKHIEIPALSRNCEVSLNALNCFQEILHCSKQMVINNIESKDESDHLQLELTSKPDNKTIELWKMAWKVWYTIGTQCFHRNSTAETSPKAESDLKLNDTYDYYAPSQTFLTSLIQIFPRLYESIKFDFSVDDFNKLSAVLENAVSVPIDLSTQTYLMTATVQHTKSNYEYLVNQASNVQQSNNQYVTVSTHSSNCTALNQQQQYLIDQSNSQIITQSVPLTPLQEAILSIMEIFQNDLFTQLSSSLNANNQNKSTSNGSNSSTISLSSFKELKNAEELLTCVFSQLLTFTTYACQPPTLSTTSSLNGANYANQLGKSLLISSSSLLNKYQSSSSQQPVDWTVMNFVPFGERSLKMATQLYAHCALWPCVIKSDIMHAFIKTLRIPLTLKYNCLSQSTWITAIQCLITLLQVGLPVARRNAEEFSTIWADLALCLEGYLFPNCSQLMVSVEELQQDELLDVKLVHIIRDSILPFANEMPKVFVLQIVSILNRGSIHSATSISPVESSRKLREEFAKACFETLLQFSFFGPKSNPNLFIQCSPNASPNSTNNAEIGLVNKLAVTSLLQRFNDVVKKYVEDENLSGKCPLPRHRMAEISFVLKALATLICSLKKAPKETVERGVWELLIELYPHLVDCTMSNSVQVNYSLREVLYEYKDLLQPPFKHKKHSNGNTN